jgi:hypothetical protein
MQNGWTHLASAPSSVLSLEDHAEAARMQLPDFIHRLRRWREPPRLGYRFAHSASLHVNLHRLRETINGREYLIEVSSVGSDKWRAQIARMPGGSAALMPFYGKTPDEAAGHLSQWLAMAHGVKRC